MKQLAHLSSLFFILIQPLVLVEDHLEKTSTIFGKNHQQATAVQLALTKKIRERIVKKQAGNPTTAKTMKPYTLKAAKLPKNNYQMLPIPAGEYQMGSPVTEQGRKADEGPQRKIKIEPFWMGKVEVTWDIYLAFMENQGDRNRNGTLDRDNDKKTFEPPTMQKGETLVEIISQPTPPFLVMHFNMGDGDGYSSDRPAISMTQHAASKFCEWLSAQTGDYYRLPTEAEWEYACRAGTTTAYFFGDDASKLGEYAWYKNNSEVDAAFLYEYQCVGEKKPNPWGLHDMYGNVTEWVLDAHQSNYSEKNKKNKNALLNPLQLSKNLYPRVTRGGHFASNANDCRSASRHPSHKKWKLRDPWKPQSQWYHTNARWLGFRIVRPLKIPELKEMHLLWNSSLGKL